MALALAPFACVQQRPETQPTAPASPAAAPATGLAPQASAAASTPVQPGDDPKTCLDQREVAERAWREGVEEKLGEKLPSLARCASHASGLQGRSLHP